MFITISHIFQNLAYLKYSTIHETYNGDESAVGIAALIRGRSPLTGNFPQRRPRRSEVNQTQSSRIRCVWPAVAGQAQYDRHAHQRKFHWVPMTFTYNIIYMIPCRKQMLL